MGTNKKRIDKSEFYQLVYDLVNRGRSFTIEGRTKNSIVKIQGFKNREKKIIELSLNGWVNKAIISKDFNSTMQFNRNDLNTQQVKKYIDYVFSVLWVSCSGWISKLK